MKHIISLLLALLLLTAAALAEDMMVVNCEEWVSLRQSPSTSAERLMKVPLYEIVEDCERAENGFTRCAYQGVIGYILDEYLEPVASDAPGTVLDATLPDGTVIQATRQYGVDSETLRVTAYGGDTVLWSIDTEVAGLNELTMTDAFIGGTATEPRVMLFNAMEGLYSLDAATGEILWLVEDDTVNLGAGIAYAVDADGAMYISGYHGPDPVCLDVNGEVRWRSDAGSDDIYWPYEISIEPRGIVTRYEMMPGEREGWVVYDRDDGRVLEVEYE